MKSQGASLDDPRAIRLALALMASFTTAALLYAVIRVVQSVLFREPDPTLVIWSPHAGFFWRSWTSGYAGGMVGFVTWVVSARRPETTARAISYLLVASTLAIAAQGLLVP